MSKKSEQQDQEVAEMLANLRKRIKPGQCVYTKIGHVSRSGMSREVHVYIVERDRRAEDGRMVTEHVISEISGYVARVCGWRRNYETGGIKVGGCGMDMGFHVVYTLGRVLFPKGGPLAKSSPTRASQSELAAARLGNKRPVIETDGGYLLKHERL